MQVSPPPVCHVTSRPARVTRGASRLLAVLLIGLAVAGCRRGLPKPAPAAIEASGARIVATADSATVRKALVRAITRFQNAWRDAWKLSEVGRHGPLAFHFLRADLDDGYFSPEVRRYQAIYCYAGWQGALAAGPRAAMPLTGDVRDRPDMMSIADLDAFRARAQSLDRLRGKFINRIRGERDTGTICPIWLPEGDDLPLDEGTNLDLALRVAYRPRLRRERDSLLDRLSVAGDRFPGDQWIAGQRVRFHLDQQQPARALAVADRCDADQSWCESLRGVALERLGRTSEAERAFAIALQSREVPADEATTCGDPYVLSLLDDAGRQRLAALPCTRRSAALDTMWWLADPLWSDAGNDRFVAHHSRDMMTRLRAAVDRDERHSWRNESGGQALRETIVRYGWPSHVYWGGRFLDDSVSINREAVRKLPDPPYPALEYSAFDRMTFIPAGDVLSQPFSSDPSSWTLSRSLNDALDDWTPTEHMSRAIPVRPMPAGQVVRLQRDSMVLLGFAVDSATPDHAPDPLSSPFAALVAGFSPNDTRIVTREAVPIDSTLRLTGTVPPLPFVLSVEVESRVPHEPIRRMRRGVQAPEHVRTGDVVLSDLALVRARALDTRSVLTASDAMSRLLGSLTLQSGEPLALYWETYGLPVGDTLDVSVEIVRNESAGVLRRVGAALGLADDLRDSVSVRWREPDAGRGVLQVQNTVPTVARTVILDLRNVAEGSYALRVQIRHIDGRTARSERLVQLRN